MKKVLLVLFVVEVMFAYAQDKKGCTEKSAVKQVMALDEVAQHIKEGENTPNSIFFMSEDESWNNRDYYVIDELKVDLNSFEERCRKAGKFEVDNLLLFINNTSTETSKRLVNTEWLKYFVKQFKIEASKLNTLMEEAIESGDLKAIEYFVGRGCIVSDIELSVVKRLKGRSLVSIEKLLKDKYASNKISDPDGYTNLRKGKGTNTDIITQIKSDEYIKVLDNVGNWLLIEAEGGQRGYVYRNRIQSK